MSRFKPENSAFSRLKTPFSEPEKPVRRCDEPGCFREGVFRAPKSREQLDKYYHFCLEHVRAYNRKWSYYADLTVDEIEEIQRRETIWNRATSPFHRGPLHKGDTFGFGRAVTGQPFRTGPDPISRLFEKEEHHRRNKERESARRMASLPSEYREALTVLSLQPPLEEAQIKAAYRGLVKKLMPVANRGDMEAERKLKSVTKAYGMLKALLEKQNAAEARQSA